MLESLEAGIWWDVIGDVKDQYYDLLLFYGCWCGMSNDAKTAKHRPATPHDTDRHCAHRSPAATLNALAREKPKALENSYLQTGPSCACVCTARSSWSVWGSFWPGRQTRTWRSKTGRPVKPKTLNLMLFTYAFICLSYIHSHRFIIDANTFQERAWYKKTNKAYILKSS